MCGNYFGDIVVARSVADLTDGDLEIGIENGKNELPGTALIGRAGLFRSHAFPFPACRGDLANEPSRPRRRLRPIAVRARFIRRQLRAQLCRSHFHLLSSPKTTLAYSAFVGHFNLLESAGNRLSGKCQTVSLGSQRTAISFPDQTEGRVRALMTKGVAVCTRTTSWSMRPLMIAGASDHR